jgi:tRNA (guanine9-N1)-methyltransferase
MSAKESTAADTSVSAGAAQGTNNDASSTSTLSKSAQKRLAKAERYAQLKLERRAREKAQKVTKRKEREERAAAGEDTGPSDAKKRRVSREGDGPMRPFNARIVIDLGFDDKMTEKVGILCLVIRWSGRNNSHGS